MSTTLRDQLLGLGFKDAPKPDTPARRRDERSGPQQHKPTPGQRGKPAHATGAPAGKPAHATRPPTGKPAPRTREDIDLAKAYAIRAQREKDERIEAERQKQEEARRRREAKAKLLAFLAGKALNAAEADHVRHFEYGGKIKRIPCWVTSSTSTGLNVPAPTCSTTSASCTP